MSLALPFALGRAKHLKKMGLANQTTMYKKETQAHSTRAHGIARDSACMI